MKAVHHLKYEESAFSLWTNSAQFVAFEEIFEIYKSTVTVMFAEMSVSRSVHMKVCLQEGGVCLQEGGGLSPGAAGTTSRYRYQWWPLQWWVRIQMHSFLKNLWNFLQVMMM